MSIEALNWALNKKLPANQKLCLICVAARAGTENLRTTWVGSEFEVHLMTGLSVEAVEKAMRRLDQRYLLNDVAKAEGDYSEYILAVGN